MSTLQLIKTYSARRENKDVAGVLALLTADVVLTVNKDRFVGLPAVKEYLEKNYAPVVQQDEPTLLPDGRVRLTLKVKKFLLTIPVTSVFKVRGNEICEIAVTFSLF